MTKRQDNATPMTKTDAARIQSDADRNDHNHDFAGGRRARPIVRSRHRQRPRWRGPTGDSHERRTLTAAPIRGAAPFPD